MSGPGTVVWIRGEVEQSMARARECLVRAGGAGATTAELRACGAHLHQVTGALQIVGMDGAARFGEEIEQFLRGIENHHPPPTEESLRLVRRCMDALNQFVAASAGGRGPSPMLLDPLFKEMQRARGIPDPSPSELFYPDLSIEPPPHQDARPVAEGALPVLVAAERSRFQRGLLAWMRGDAGGIAAMRESLGAIDAAGLAPRERTLWWTAGAMTEALIAGALQASPAIKKLCARVDQQMKHFAKGRTFVAERLLRDVLYQVACARPTHALVARVQAHYALDALMPREDATSFGSLEAQERERVSAEAREGLRRAKLSWLSYATGQSASLEAFASHVVGLRTAAGRLLNLPLMRLSEAIAHTARSLSDAGGERPEEVMAEMASALLVAESALEFADEASPELNSQVELIRRRLLEAPGGGTVSETLPPVALPDPLDARPTRTTPLGEVAREVRSNLHHIEQLLDGFFRDARRRPRVSELAPLLKQVLGAFKLLDLDEASELMSRCERLIYKLARDDRSPSDGDVERVADGLSSLDLYVQELEHEALDGNRLLHDALSRFSPRESADGPRRSVREAPVKSLEAEIRLSLARIARLGDAWEDARSDPAPARELAAELEALGRDAEVVGDGALTAAVEDALMWLRRGARRETVGALRALAERDEPPGPLRPSPEAARLVNARQEVVEQELFRVYLREAREVLASIGGALEVCRHGERPHEALLTIRRCFHTLKGSGRMVRLDDLAEAALRIEQVLNHWLQEDLAPTPDLVTFVGEARDAFTAWVDQLERHGHLEVDASALQARARALIEQAQAGSTSEPPGGAARATAPGSPLSGELFQVFVEEASGHLESLRGSLARGPGLDTRTRQEMLRSAHTLAGISRTAGFPALGTAAASLERWLTAASRAPLPPAGETQVAGRALAAIAESLQDVREGRPPRDCASAARELDTATQELEQAPSQLDDAGDGTEELRDDIDQSLLPLFLEEAEDLMSVVGEELRQWRRAPDNAAIPQALRRILHTLKGSARLVGAMRFGDVVHRMEAQLADAIGIGEFPPSLMDRLEDRLDGMGALLQGMITPAPADTAPAVPTPPPGARLPITLTPEAMVPAIRVSAHTLDGLVSRAGEVSIARGHVEAEIQTVRTLMSELSDTVTRLRAQLREMELHAEIATPAQLAAGPAAVADFDPLEFDRYTRLQELSRLMAESTADVITVQTSLRRTLDGATTSLRALARSGRDLQDTLTGVRTVAFTTVVDRLYRVLRQTCRETGKKARIEVVGQNVELDRGVLEKLVPALEHLLRNAVAHGIEPAEARRAQGKEDTGEVRVEVRQEPNEVILEVADDGAGIDYAVVRRRALDEQLLSAEQAQDPTALRRLIFSPGFTTVSNVTEVAGRGVGLDAVRSDVQTLGGWVELESAEGRGTLFRLHLPLTLVVVQALLVKAAGRSWALPTHMVEHVQRIDAAALDAAYRDGHLVWGARRYRCHFLAHLLGEPGDPPRERRNPMVLVHAGEERLALHVESALRNHEAVLRNLGPQISSIPGVIGATILPDGEITPILNPFFLASYQAVSRAVAPARAVPAVDEDSRPLVLAVDDSLTVRRLIENLLGRNGYRVVTARDGVEAEHVLREYRPQVMLVDIEMPRMDGFELTRIVRGNRSTAHIPIIIITSRSAEKHRAHALKLGADLFIGKPFDEAELLHHVAGFTSNRAVARDGSIRA